MWPFKKKTKVDLTYEEEHNKAYNSYKKAALIAVWAGVLNVLGLLIAILQVNSEVGEFKIFLCFGVVELFIRLMAKVVYFQSNQVLFHILNFLFATLVSTGFVLLGVFASQGKRKALIAGIVAYFIDMCILIPLAITGLETIEDLWLSAAVHVVIFVFMIIAVYQYYKIVKIAIKHGVLKEVKEEERKD